MSGRPDYNAGDLVVCVNAAPIPGLPYDMGSLRRCALYTVVEVLLNDNSDQWGCVVKEARSCGQYGGYDASRFRRIDPKPPEFWTGTVDADAGDRVPA